MIAALRPARAVDWERVQIAATAERGAAVVRTQFGFKNRSPKLVHLLGVFSVVRLHWRRRSVRATSLWEKAAYCMSGSRSANVTAFRWKKFPFSPTNRTFPPS